MQRALNDLGPGGQLVLLATVAVIVVVSWIAAHQTEFAIIGIVAATYVAFLCFAVAWKQRQSANQPSRIGAAVDGDAAPGADAQVAQ